MLLGTLQLGSNRLNGTISSLLAKLPLVDLRLHNNDFIGTIPTELGLLTGLSKISRGAGYHAPIRCDSLKVVSTLHSPIGASVEPTYRVSPISLVLAYRATKFPCQWQLCYHW
jgi:hypothetical protein